MIISHTVNVDGKRRIYLGAQSSIDTWLEPKDDGRRWSVRFNSSDCGYHSREDILQAIVGQMNRLARALAVEPERLDDVAFDAIAALHTASNTRERRIPSPQRDTIETGFMVTPPGVARSKNDFSAPDFHKYHTKGRSRGHKP